MKIKKWYREDLTKAIQNKCHILIQLEEGEYILGVPEKSKDDSLVKIRKSNKELVWVPVKDINNLSVVISFDNEVARVYGNCGHCGLTMDNTTQYDNYPEYCDDCVKLLGFDENT